jgi:hypothetical protein
MTQRPGRKNDLSAMMGFMCHKVGHEMCRVGRYVGPRDFHGQCSIPFEPRVQQFDDAAVASPERLKAVRVTRLRSTLRGALIL